MVFELCVLCKLSRDTSSRDGLAAAEFAHDVAELRDARRRLIRYARELVCTAGRLFAHALEVLHVIVDCAIAFSR